jgi:NTP pyrophosphatase (non-canonical NTP hydrolase)
MSADLEGGGVMTLAERQKIYSRAWLTWGQEAQILLAIEEMAELTQVLTKYLNGRLKYKHRELLSEIADVQIMVEQLAYQLDPDGVENKVEEKIERLQQRLNVENQSSKTCEEER